MSKLINELLSAQQIPNYLHPFTGLSDEDTYETIEERAVQLKNIGIRSMDLMWHSRSGGMDMHTLSKFNDEVYWERISWVADVCRKHGMTFMMQDAAPFPTGAADGLFELPENHHLNKMYLSERHLDVTGPVADGAFLADTLVGAMRIADRMSGKPVLPGDEAVAYVALRRDGDHYDFSTAVDLTDNVEDGMLFWDVPEGVWRLYCIFKTHSGTGRAYYMNLLDAESVALNIKALHQPHYEHLKDEIGKTWLGFFYDETEVGNIDGYAFEAVVGANKDVLGSTMDLPWSNATLDLCREAWGEDYRRNLALLWCKDEGAYHAVRCRYMDIISRQIRDNYNGQMHKWCQERGIQYIGHNLEDEDSHTRMGCGPVHYFRMQKHQDIAGIDLIGNQIWPGKDYAQSWYGYPEGDGQFYHYGLAKIGSSEGHISPNKKGRSFCEVFAVYGKLAGSRTRKYILDHLFVNGINELIPADPSVPGADPAISRRENDYSNRMCHLLQKTRPAIKTALLYHAEAEWYQGAYQMFQVPAQQLAKHQISYDVVPSDVFEDTDFYRTDWSDGLVINGNRYEALIVPGADALPASVAAFLTHAKATGFPVFFCDWMPTVIAETGEALAVEYGSCVAINALAEAVGGAIARDIILETPVPELRYSRFADEEGTYYFLHNEGAAAKTRIWVPYPAPVCRVDLAQQTTEAVATESADGGSWITLNLVEYEAVLLYFGADAADAPVKTYASVPVDASWKVTLDDGTVLNLDSLVNLNGSKYYPRYTGIMRYETTVNWETAPVALDLGQVYEIATVYVNAELAGSAQFAPYRIDLKGLAKVGENTLRIDVKPNTARSERRSPFMGGMQASTYNVMDPGGLLGPVTALK